MTCPACEGKGVVSIEFTEDTPTWVKATKFEREPCTLCNGSGIVTKEKYQWTLKQLKT